MLLHDAEVVVGLESVQDGEHLLVLGELRARRQAARCWRSEYLTGIATSLRPLMPPFLLTSSTSTLIISS